MKTLLLVDVRRFGFRLVAWGDWKGYHLSLQIMLLDVYFRQKKFQATTNFGEWREVNHLLLIDVAKATKFLEALGGALYKNFDFMSEPVFDGELVQVVGSAPINMMWGNYQICLRREELRNIVWAIRLHFCLDDPRERGV